MTPPRVLHVVGALSGGGIQTMLLGIMEQHARMGIRADVLAMAVEPGALASRAETLGARVYTLPLAGQPLRFMAGMRKLLQAGRYDVVHTWRSSAMQAVPLAVARTAGVRVRVAHFQNVANPPGTSRFRRMSDRVLGPLLRCSATHLIAVSEAVAASQRAALSLRPGRIIVIPNGVPVEAIRAASIHREAMRAELGLAPEDFVVGHAGRFSLAKNHAGIIRVAAALRDVSPRCVFVLMGDGPRMEACRALARELCIDDRVRFTGWREDGPRVLGAMDAFFFPSHWEGLPLALLEAMAAGLPCITSGIAPCREALPAEAWALRVPAASPLRAVATLRDLAMHPDRRAALAAACASRAEAFDIANAARRIAGIYGGSSS